jgi:hypothetical protein
MQFIDVIHRDIVIFLQPAVDGFDCGEIGFDGSRRVSLQLEIFFEAFDSWGLTEKFVPFGQNAPGAFQLLFKEIANGDKIGQIHLRGVPFEKSIQILI